MEKECTARSTAHAKDAPLHLSALKRCIFVSVFLLFYLSCSYPSVTTNISGAHSYASGGSSVMYKWQIYFRALIACISRHTKSFSLCIFCKCACAKTIPTTLQGKAWSVAELSRTCKHIFNTDSSWINKGTLWKWKWFPRQLLFTIRCQI